MKIVEGKGIPLGRLASFAAKESLKGEEISIINCDEVIITGNFHSIRKSFEEKRGRIGSSQKGPKHPATTEKIVKRAIRGMLPNPKKGRGKIAFKKIRCYSKTPKEFENIKPIEIATGKKIKYSEVRKFIK
ncbi:50S ribosomal protein L13 [Candidatus Pacearchaeota archaeon]|nr:50S ribosomal protein L13 [Candidatus Pacearchaeota archaeon]